MKKERKKERKKESQSQSQSQSQTQPQVHQEQWQVRTTINGKKRLSTSEPTKVSANGNGKFCHAGNSRSEEDEDKDDQASPADRKIGEWKIA